MGQILVWYLLVFAPTAQALDPKTENAISAYRREYQRTRERRATVGDELVFRHTIAFADTLPALDEFEAFLRALFDPAMPWLDTNSRIPNPDTIEIVYSALWAREIVRQPSPRTHSLSRVPNGPLIYSTDTSDSFRRSVHLDPRLLAETCISAFPNPLALQNLGYLNRADQEVALLILIWGPEASARLAREATTAADRRLNEQLDDAIRRMLPAARDWIMTAHGTIPPAIHLLPTPRDQIAQLRFISGEAWPAFSEGVLGFHHPDYVMIANAYETTPEEAVNRAIGDTFERISFWMTWFGDQEIGLSTRRNIQNSLPDLRDPTLHSPDRATRYLARLRTWLDIPRGDGLIAYYPQISHVLQAAPEFTVTEFEEFIPLVGQIFGIIAHAVNANLGEIPAKPDVATSTRFRWQEHARPIIRWIPLETPSQYSGRLQTRIRLPASSDSATRARLLDQLQDAMLAEVRIRGELPPEILDRLFTTSVFEPRAYLTQTGFSEELTFAYGMRYIRLKDVLVPPPPIPAGISAESFAELRAATWLATQTVDIKRVFLRRWEAHPLLRVRDQEVFLRLARLENLTPYTRGTALDLALSAGRYWNQDLSDLMRFSAEFPPSVLAVVSNNFARNLSPIQRRTNATYLPWAPQPDGPSRPNDAHYESWEYFRNQNPSEAERLEQWDRANAFLIAMARLRTGNPTPIDAGVVFHRNNGMTQAVVAQLASWGRERPGLITKALRALQERVALTLEGDVPGSFDEALNDLEKNPNCVADGVRGQAFLTQIHLGVSGP